MRSFEPRHPLSEWIACACVLAAMLVMTVTCAPKAPPPSKDAFVQQGDQLLAKKEYAKAAAAYQVAVDVDGRDGVLRVKLANTYLLAGDWAAAQQQAVRASDLLPGDLDVQLLSAKLMLAQRRFVDVSDRMSVFLKQHPDNVAALVLLANATAHLQDSTWALYSLPEAIRDRVRFEGARRAIRPGTASEEDKAAEALFRKAMQLAPNDIDTELAFVNYLWATGRPDEGEEILRRVADRYSGHAAVNYALGSYYLSRQRDADGERYLKNAAASGDYGREARFSLADHYIAAHRDAEAIAFLNSMAAGDDAEGAVATRIAAVEFRTGRQADAMRRVEAILSKDPGNKRALLLKAQLLSAASNWKEAVNIARIAAAEDPNSGEVRLTLGRALLATGDRENAFKELSEAFRLDPASTDIPIELTKIALSLGREQSALQFARDAVRKNPENREVALSLVQTLLEVHDFSGADTSIKGLLARYPAAPDVLSELGALEVARGNNQAARATFSRALQTDPNSFAALSGLVSLDLKEKRVPDARRQVEDAPASQRHDPEYLLLAGRVYAADRDNARAESVFRQALEIDSANEGAALALADLLRDHRSDEAKGVIDQLLAHRPGSIEGHITMGGLLEQMGRPADAAVEYETVLTLKPKAAMVSYRLASIYAEDANKLDAAIGLALSAKQQLGGDPAVSDVVGWLYVKKNDSGRALSYLQEAVRGSPDNSTYHFHLGIAYRREAQFARARSELTRALQLNPNFPQAAQARAELASIPG